MQRFVTVIVLTGLSLVARAQTLSGVCMVSASGNALSGVEDSGLVLRQSNCEQGRHCVSSENSSIPWSRWSGISPNALAQEGAQMEATMTADPGELRCAGTVHQAVLAGRYTFTPSASFQSRMSEMGFENLTASKLQGFLMLDVTLAWVRGMKDAGVTGITTDQLMGLRALQVTPEYIHQMAQAGYPELAASKLIEMKAVGVTPEKAREAESLGFRPSQQELIQMTIFKIDRPFIERMRARGLTDLTVAKLIQVKIFKLDE